MKQKSKNGNKLKISIYLLLILFVVPGFAYAQEEGDSLWSLIEGSPAMDLAGEVQQTTDGGYILVGTYNNDPMMLTGDVYMLKTDVNGNITWTRNHNWGPGAWSGRSIQQTTDGGYIIAGGVLLDMMASINYALLIKTDANGDTVWTRNNSDYPDSYHNIFVRQLADGGYIVSGTKVGPGMMMTADEAVLTKFDADGDTVWTRLYGGDNYAYRGGPLLLTADGGYIVAGITMETEMMAYADAYIFKTNSDGDLMWTRTFSAGDVNQIPTFIQHTADGGYIIVGGKSGGMVSEAFLMKLDINGDAEWTSYYAGVGEEMINAMNSGVLQTADGGYILAAGKTGEGFPPPMNALLIRTDANGDTLWTRTYGNGGSAGRIQHTADGNYIISGEYMPTDSYWYDIYMLKVTGMGVPGYAYLPGDCNMALGLWPPQVIGGDVSYLVGYFIGSGNAPCNLDEFWASADVSGDCTVIGGDVSALVGYLIGTNPEILYCPDYEPAWLEGVPEEQPSGWPNCDAPVINSKIIPTGLIK